MSLEEFWFVLIAVLWAGYFVLEGFDFGVGMLLPFVPRRRARSRHPAGGHRPRLGRQRGVAGGRCGRDLRRVPRVVRDDVLGLLHRAAAHPRPADRAGRRVRVARAGRRPPLARGVALVRDRGQLRRAVPLGRRPLEPAARRAGERRRRLHRRRPRPVQPLLGRRRPRGGGALRLPRRGLPDPADDRAALRVGERDRPAARHPCRGAGRGLRRVHGLRRRRHERPRRVPAHPPGGAGRSRARRRGAAGARGPQRLGLRGHRRRPRCCWSRRCSPRSTRASSSPARTSRTA